MAPSSLSSYSTLKPEMVEEAEVQDTTKLLEVISVTDSEVSNTGGGTFVSPSEVSTGDIQGYNVPCERFLLPIFGIKKKSPLKSTHENRGLW